MNTGLEAELKRFRVNQPQISKKIGHAQRKIFSFLAQKPLETLLDEFDIDNPSSKALVVSANIKRELTPNYVDENKIKYTKYEASILGDRYTLHTQVGESRDNLLVECKIDFDHMEVKYQIGERKFKKIIPAKKGAFLLDQINPEILSIFVGLHLGLRSKNGINNGTPTYIPQSYEGRLIVTLFDNDNKFLFNSKGEEIVQKGEEEEKKKIFEEKEDHRIRQIFNSAKKKTSKEELFLSAIEYLTSKWRNNTQEYNRRGVMIPIRGRVEKITDLQGRIQFMYHDRIEEQRYLPLGLKPNTVVDVEIHQNLSLILVNGYAVKYNQTDHVGFECSTMSGQEGEISEFLKLRTIDPTRELYLKEGDRRLFVPFATLKKHLNPEFDQYGILWHRKPKKDDCYLLMRNQASRDITKVRIPSQRR